MVRLKVNGIDRSFDGDPEMPLLWYLRDELKLTGAKFGCGIALCGACTVHKNAEAIRSCVTAMRDMAGAEITTIEGPEPKWPPPGPKGMDADQCAAMRLLSAGPNHAGGGSFEWQKAAHRSGDR